jgi:hypothetical protein
VHSFSACSISTINQRLDQSPDQIRRAAFVRSLPVSNRGSRYERIREAENDCQPCRADCHRRRLGWATPVASRNAIAIRLSAMQSGYSTVTDLARLRG